MPGKTFWKKNDFLPTYLKNFALVMLNRRFFKVGLIASPAWVSLVLWQTAIWVKMTFLIKCYVMKSVFCYFLKKYRLLGIKIYYWPLQNMAILHILRGLSTSYLKQFWRYSLSSSDSSHKKGWGHFAPYEKCVTNQMLFLDHQLVDFWRV